MRGWSQRDRERDDDHRRDDRVEPAHRDRAEQQPGTRATTRRRTCVGGVVRAGRARRTRSRNASATRVEHGDHQRPRRRVPRAAARPARPRRRASARSRRPGTPRRPRAPATGRRVEPEPHPVAVQVEVPERLLGDQHQADEREPAVHEDERDPDGGGGVQQAAEQRDLRGSGRTRPTDGQGLRLARHPLRWPAACEITRPGRPSTSGCTAAGTVRRCAGHGEDRGVLGSSTRRALVVGCRRGGAEEATGSGALSVIVDSLVGRGR